MSYVPIHLGSYIFPIFASKSTAEMVKFGFPFEFCRSHKAMEKYFASTTRLSC